MPAWFAGAERLECRTLLSAVVTTTADSGAGSLREAILDANANTGPQTITFDIPGVGVQVIAPLTALPMITNSVTIDATTQPGYAGMPLIELDGEFAGTDNVDGLFVGAASNSVIRGFDVNRFSGVGIDIQGGYGDPAVPTTGIIVEDCYIGVDPTGTISQANGQGIQVLAVTGFRIANDVASGNTTLGIGMGSSASNGVVVGCRIGTNAAGTAALGNGSDGMILGGVDHVTIGGTNLGDGNIISGNLGTVYSGENGGAGRGIYLVKTADIDIQGNLIGTDVTGTFALGNAFCGILDSFGTGSMTIGGPQAAARNVISGNHVYGAAFGEVFTPVTIQGNYIGTNAAGTSALNLTGTGIFANVTGGIQIGGTAPGEGNLISGNGAGVELLNAGNFVQGNYIGTDATGACTIGNGDGIYVGGENNLIGGEAAGAGNLISGNIHGIYFASGNGGNVVQGNLIGTDVCGTKSLGNFMGVLVGSARNLIGTNSDGTNDAAERNIISGSSFAGIYFTSSGHDNVIAGNYVGTDVTGKASLGNVFGIVMAVAGNLVGTNGDGVYDAIERNIISGNSYAGILLSTADAHDNVIAGNDIGTDATGTAPLANSIGIWSDAGAYGNQIGSTSAGQANVIAFNGGNGVTVTGNNSFGDSIRGNAIYGNAGLGIDLGDAGVTANDADDPDAGPNGLQNFPVLSLVEVGTTTHIYGTIQGAANATLTVDFYSNTAADPSAFGQGETYLGSTVVTTDGSGSAVFDVNLAASTSIGNVISATATDAAWNTSEFSADVTAVADAPLTDTTVVSTQNATVGVGTGNVVLATFTDGNPYASVTDFTAVVNFGGPVVGTPAASIQLVSRAGAVSTWQVVGNVTYAAAGNFVATVTVNDVDGSSFTTSNTSFNVTTNAAILLLDPTGRGALTDSGNGKIIVGGNGKIVVASTNAAAVVVSGHGTVDGTIDQNSGDAVDPLAGLAAPTAPAMQFSAANISGDSVVTLQPGTYNGGIQISGSAHVTLAPGIYYLNGGWFSVTGNAVVTGTGVFIYNAAQSAADTLSISGNARVTLSAQTSGDYQGIVFFQARTSTAQIYVSGSAALVLTGTLYAPKAKVNVSGSGLLQLLGSASELIAADLIVSGNGIVKVDA